MYFECRSTKIIKNYSWFECISAKWKKKSSSKCNEVVTSNEVVWYDFKGFLDQFYEGNIKEISSNHHFYVNKINPGEIIYKRLVDSNATSKVNILKKNVSVNDIINPTGNYKKLEHYIVNPATYSLTMNESTNKNKIRKKYLDDNFVEVYFPPNDPCKGLYFDHGGEVL